MVNGLGLNVGYNKVVERRSWGGGVSKVLSDCVCPFYHLSQRFKKNTVGIFLE